MIDYLAGVTELRGKTTNLRSDHQNLVLETWGNRWNMLDLYKLNIAIYSFANNMVLRENEKKHGFLKVKWQMRRIIKNGRRGNKIGEEKINKIP